MGLFPSVPARLTPADRDGHDCGLETEEGGSCCYTTKTAKKIEADEDLAGDGQGMADPIKQLRQMKSRTRTDWRRRVERAHKRRYISSKGPTFLG